jgi:hypothetical protein
LALDCDQVPSASVHKPILTQCLQSDLLCGNIHCDQFGSLRESNDGLTEGGYIMDPKVNNGSLLERGVDVDLSYSFDIGSLGKIRAALVGAYAVFTGLNYPF